MNNDRQTAQLQATVEDPWGYRSYTGKESEFCCDLGSVYYQSLHRAWIATSTPQTSIEDLGRLVERFAQAASDRGAIPLFIGLRQPLPNTQWKSVEIGAQPIWDPENWLRFLQRSPSLRYQISRARRKVDRLRWVHKHEQIPVHAMDRATRAWLSQHRLPTLGFLSQINPSSSAEHQEVLLAYQQEQLLAYAIVRPMGTHGRFVEHLVRTQQAPNGTSELLIHTIMQQAHQDKCQRVTLGMVALRNPPNLWLAIAKRLSQSFYSYEGIESFRSRLRPHHWEPLYLCYPDSVGANRALLLLLQAFAGGSILRFGLTILKRTFEPQL